MTELAAYTEGEATDMAICKKVADVLQRHYPGYEWLVGIADRFAGTVTIGLPEKYVPPSLRLYGYLLHLSNVDDEKQVRNAGGEWLERLRLARERAREWGVEQARENGLDLGNVVTKSRA